MTICKTRRDAALVILQTGERLTRYSGGFLGQLVVDDTPLSEKQARWFNRLAESNGVIVMTESSDD